MASAAIVNRANAMAFGIGAVIGESPHVVEFADHVEITWTDDQLKILSQKFEDMISKPGGEIQIKAEGIFYPFIVKRGGPWLFGAAGLGYVVGRI